MVSSEFFFYIATFTETSGEQPLKDLVKTHQTANINPCRGALQFLNCVRYCSYDFQQAGANDVQQVSAALHNEYIICASKLCRHLRVVSVCVKSELIFFRPFS